MNIPLRRTLFSSLALRVLLTSALFVIIPLIFYAGIIYKRDYNEKVRDVFQEMTIFQKDQITYLLQLEEGTLNVLEIFKQLSPFIDNQKSLDTVLADFAYKGKLSAFFHLNEDMVCVSSTLPAYVNKALFTLDHVEKGVFIAEDPVLGYSLFITLPLVENGHLMEALADPCLIRASNDRPI